MKFIAWNSCLSHKEFEPVVCDSLDAAQQVESANRVTASDCREWCLMGSPNWGGTTWMEVVPEPEKYRPAIARCHARVLVGDSEGEESCGNPLPCVIHGAEDT